MASFLILFIVGIFWGIYIASGNDYAKAGISCKEGQFDTSEVPKKAQEKVKAAIGSIKVCSYENGEWDLYDVSRFSESIRVGYAETTTYSESEICDADELWQGETITVGSDVFVGPNATGLLQDALEANGFKTSDFKPDFC